jgi:hypothetical protein
MISQKIIQFTKREASAITGGATQTSKMPCKSYSLPTAACQTGWQMAQVEGSICSKCYAQKGFYSLYAATVEPAQHARLVALDDPLWVDAMATLIGADKYFRWHDSGDIQSLEHLQKIADVCDQTPFLATGRKLPGNLVIRLSAMYPDTPVIIPKSLRGVAGIAASNVHSKSAPIGSECEANKRGGKCGDCRKCWDRAATVSYRLH